MNSQEWRAQFNKTGTLNDLQIDSLIKDYDKKEHDYVTQSKELSDLEDKKEDLEEILANCDTPEWGNCRRGCDPSYLDSAGFCSPACAVGSPTKGQFYTSPSYLSSTIKLNVQRKRVGQ